MFIDESAFDMDDGIPSVGNHGNGQNNDLAINLMEDDMEDLSLSGGGTLNSAGGLGTSSASRARMLAQQRDLQLKKRQSTAASGMVRSSIDKSDGSNFTVRQFSAPKAATFGDDDDDSDLQPSSSSRTRTGNNRFGRERQEEDDFDYNTRSPSRRSRDDWGGDRRGDRDRDRERERNSRDRDDSRDRGGRREYRSRGDSRDRDRDERRRRSRSPDYYGRGHDSRDRDSRDRRDRDRDRDDSRDRNRRDRDRDRDWDRDERDRRGGRSRGRDYSDDDDNYYRGGRKSGGRDRDRDDSRDRGGRDRDRDRDDSRDRGNRRDRGRDRDYDRDWDRDRDRDRSKDRRRDRSNDGYGSDDRGEKWTSAANGDRSMPVGASSKHAQRTDKGREQGNKQLNPNRPMSPADMDLSDMESFLLSPLPRGKGVVQCYIIRNKSGTHKLFPIYSLYLKDGDRFLMCSKKRANNKTSNYLISKAEGDLNKESVNCLGKLRSNFVGTEFQVYDNGVNPNGDSYGQGATRRELAAVTYAPNVLGSRGPRKMQVAIPAVDEIENTILANEQSKNGEDDILQRMKDRNLKNLYYFINKPPRWNEQVGAYVLNFSGRVTMASVKNFQLVDPDEQNAIVLQFGRVGKDQFTMDMQWPMSPYQAFAITMSSFDSKIACD